MAHWFSLSVIFVILSFIFYIVEDIFNNNNSEYSIYFFTLGTIMFAIATAIAIVFT